jgi:hypothetical protein
VLFDEANGVAVFTSITKAALDSDRGRSDRAGFVTIVLPAEPLGTNAPSIERKIFSYWPTISFNTEPTGVFACGRSRACKQGATSILNVGSDGRHDL